MNNIFIYKSEEERNFFRKAGRLAATVLDLVCQRVAPGISTMDLDLFAEQWIKDHGAIPTFKGYQDFPATLCTSINNEIVHGIPSKERILQEGDLVKIDVGVTLKAKIDGKEQTFIGDNARTEGVGKISEKAQKLIDDIKAGLFAGIEQCAPGKKISDIAREVEKVGRANNYGLVKEFGGHGIGPAYHVAPFIPNYSDYFCNFEDCVIREGMILAVEPMFNLGLDDIRKLRDGWTIVTKDNKLSAHYEHSVLVTAKGPEILTVVDPSLN
ncbi:MAG: type I methionyl aminopeptidase [Candidatus Caenarcaniphilales bacterium]|nr:type I methionyl aminopeptidase [Candidatus Caenarcaniphilales bacterium]